MPLPQPPIQTAPSFAERLFTSGTLSRAGTGIATGIIQGKQLADWKRFVQGGEASSKALYNWTVQQFPELTGELPQPYFDPQNPNAYLLEVAKVTTAYKRRKGLATGFREYGQAMQRRRQRIPTGQPAQPTVPGQQPAPTRTGMMQFPQQDIPAMAELSASAAEAGALEQIQPILTGFTEAITKNAETMRKALEVNMDAMQQFSNLATATGLTGMITGVGEAEGFVTPEQILTGATRLQLGPGYRPSQFRPLTGQAAKTEEARRRAMLNVAEDNLNRSLESLGMTLKEYIAMTPEARQRRFRWINKGTAAQMADVEDQRRDLERILGRKVFPEPAPVTEPRGF
jgi:hypothetical protein